MSVVVRNEKRYVVIRYASSHKYVPWNEFDHVIDKDTVTLLTSSCRVELNRRNNKRQIIRDNLKKALAKKENLVKETWNDEYSTDEYSTDED